MLHCPPGLPMRDGAPAREPLSLLSSLPQAYRSATRGAVISTRDHGPSHETPNLRSLSGSWDGEHPCHARQALSRNVAEGASGSIRSRRHAGTHRSEPTSPAHLNPGQQSWKPVPAIQLAPSGSHTLTQTPPEVHWKPAQHVLVSWHGTPPSPHLATTQTPLSQDAPMQQVLELPEPSHVSPGLRHGMQVPKPVALHVRPR